MLGAPSRSFLDNFFHITAFFLTPTEARLTLRPFQHFQTHPWPLGGSKEPHTGNCGSFYCSGSWRELLRKKKMARNSGKALALVTSKKKGRQRRLRLAAQYAYSRYQPFVGMGGTAKY